MTPELKQQIDKEAKAHCDMQIGDRAKFHYKDPMHVLWHSEFDGYIAGATDYVEQVEALKRWKAEASTLLDPIIEYGQSHPAIKLGASCTEFVLNRAKDYDALFEHAERLREAIETFAKKYTISDDLENALEEYKNQKQ